MKRIISDNRWLFNINIINDKYRKWRIIYDNRWNYYFNIKRIIVYNKNWNKNYNKWRIVSDNRGRYGYYIF